MGYTHYWTLNRAALSTAALAEGFEFAATEIKTLKRYLPKEIKIRGGLGIELPIIGTKRIWFNGDSKHDLDHETFDVDRDVDALYPDNGRGFCKTNRKPYDVLVCCSLIALAKRLPGAFSFTSDGDKSDWESAIRFYDTNFSGGHAVRITANLHS